MLNKVIYIFIVLLLSSCYVKYKTPMVIYSNSKSSLYLYDGFYKVITIENDESISNKGIRCESYGKYILENKLLILNSYESIFGIEIIEGKVSNEGVLSFVNDFSDECLEFEKKFFLIVNQDTLSYNCKINGYDYSKITLLDNLNIQLLDHFFTSSDKILVSKDEIQKGVLSFNKIYTHSKLNLEFKKMRYSLSDSNLIFIDGDFKTRLNKDSLSFVYNNYILLDSNVSEKRFGWYK